MERTPPHSLKLLVLDDTPEVRKRLVADLREVEGVEISWQAETIAEAREVLATFRPDVAILDRRLPDGDGLDLVREIRAAGPDTVVIILTALEAPHCGGRTASEPVDFYLQKATGFEQLPDLLRGLVACRSIGEPA